MSKSRAPERPKYRAVATRLWGDEKFRRLTKPQPNGQSLWIYLLAGPYSTNVPGCIRAKPNVLAADLEWPEEGFRQAFADVLREGLAKADEEAGFIFLPGGPRHNPPASPNVITSWRATWEELPECPLKAEAWQALKAFVEGLGKGFGKGLSKGFNKAWMQAFTQACRQPFIPEQNQGWGKAWGKPLGNQDQDQDQDQEQEGREALPLHAGKPSPLAGSHDRFHALFAELHSAGGFGAYVRPAAFNDWRERKLTQALHEIGEPDVVRQARQFFELLRSGSFRDRAFATNKPLISVFLDSLGAPVLAPPAAEQSAGARLAAKVAAREDARLREQERR